MSYRHRFDADGSAASYDGVEYAPGTYSSLLWTVERAQLARIVADLRRTHTAVSCLDFATGTGRVLGFLETLVDSAIGIDVSAAMVARAGQRVRSRVVCADLTACDALPDETFDLVTAFRFLLNAEQPLRVSALEALRARMKDEASLLVVNNHGNLMSHKALLWPVHRARRGGGHQAAGNYLTHRECVRLLTQARFDVVAVYGCGLTPGRLVDVLGSARVQAWEQRFATTPLARFGANQMYVARPR